MWTFIPFILRGVSELIRWQQFAPKLSMGSFEGGQVYKKQNGSLRHSNVQSNTSDTATVPTSSTFKYWNSCLINVRLRKVLVEEARFPSGYMGFDSVKGKKSSPVIKGHDGTTHRREWWGRDWLVTKEDKVAYRRVAPPPFPIPFK